MKLYSWNVNGIRSAGRNGYPEWFSDTKPDILCLQEIKAHPGQLPQELSHPPDYHCYWNSAKRPGYSGVVVFSRQKAEHIRTGLGITEFDREGRVIELDFGRFTLLNIYFPNGQRDHARVPFKLDFCKSVLERCEVLRTRKKKIIVCWMSSKRPLSCRKFMAPTIARWVSPYLTAKILRDLRSVRINHR